MTGGYRAGGVYAGAGGGGAGFGGGGGVSGADAECGSCGVTCGGGGGSGGLSYVGNGQGAYVQETTYKYVGCGGDFDVKQRRDFTCIITTCCLLPLLLLLLWWLLSGLFTTSLPFDCSQGVENWRLLWSDEKMQYCCMTTGMGCSTTAFPATTPTAPPTPPPTAPPPPPRPRPIPRPTRPAPAGDPYNCAVDAVEQWGAGKKAWCCSVHHKGCPGQPVMPVAPIMPVSPPLPPPPLAVPGQPLGQQQLPGQPQGQQLLPSVRSPGSSPNSRPLQLSCHKMCSGPNPTQMPFLATQLRTSTLVTALTPSPTVKCQEKSHQQRRTDLFVCGTACSTKYYIVFVTRN